ncbi:hypothetical protein AMJ49_05535 [Parcubacteria bacterium DG_74_2]|nr:MAG: hypothetical protein AMJ49_05535 [Parcubacteria bacterium DG_74_2]
MKRKTLGIMVSLLVVISVLLAFAVYDVYHVVPQQDTSSPSRVVDEMSTSKPYKIEIISEPSVAKTDIGKLGIIRIIGLESRYVNRGRSYGCGYALTEGLKEVDLKYDVVDITPIDYHSRIAGGGSETVELIVLVNNAK